MPAALGELFRTTQPWKGINGSDAVEASLQPEAAAIISDPGVHGISVLLRSPHRPGGKSGVSWGEIRCRNPVRNPVSVRNPVRNPVSVHHSGGKSGGNRDCSIATGAGSKIARQEQGESTWDPINASELAPNSANGLIPSLIARAKSQPPGNVAIVSENGSIHRHHRQPTT